ncbi:MAG TPA: beta-ketoacyl synthase N-terminal-like domain-containing protein [Opitutaceae bacterium]|nr:beta-ketoacyl synthase N-terminal-like domain-containing protein [Opitutaceae bacterium]
MKRRRVKITGLGPVTPAGIGRAAFAAGINEPVSRVHEYKGFARQGAGAFVAAEVESLDLEALGLGSAKRLPRHTQFALAGAALAVADAGLRLEELRDVSPLITVGASLMDFGVMNRIMETILRKGPAFGLPSAVFSSSVSAISGAVAEVVGGGTRTLALQSACCSGLDAIGHAANAIATGEAELAVCGGTEAPLYFHPMIELKMAGLTPDTAEMPERICRPFDCWRTTGVISEGACLLVLEPEESPRPAYALVDGYAYATDPAEQPVAGLAEAIRLTLGNAGRRQHEVDCINAWGPGHKLVDRAEAQVLKAIFGARLAEIPTVSIKGAIGNPLGAGGAIQVASAALALRSGVIPPTVNWQYPDPDCPLNLSAAARHVAHGVTLINSHGLSGTNACLLLSN